MLKIEIRKYRLKKSPNVKKAIFISFEAPLAKENYSKVKNSLKDFSKKYKESCVIQLKDENLSADGNTLNAYLVKLLISMAKSWEKPFGILAGKDALEFFRFTQLDNFFLVSESLHGLLSKFENNKQDAVSPDYE